MQLRGVEVADGTTATLWFTDGGVHVVARAARRQALLRWAGGSAFGALALAMTGMGVGAAVNARAGEVLFAAAGALAVFAVATAVAGWVLSVRAGRAIRDGVTAPDLPLEGIQWARSTEEGGRVRVSVGMADGEVHEFAAAGMTGADLVRQFAGLLNADGGPPGGSPAPE
ncbi:hypothetical protein ACQEVZ_48480 [Dactylosporangium sp. CA-152071]|uniref:hypothetical protein n=1 Tax=Dactylosporangium sp. CA-152071 TaxID=3239933 RepID=UPI003D9048F6